MALGIHRVPGGGITTRLLDSINQPDAFLTEQIVDDQRDVCRLRNIIGDRCTRVVRIRSGEGQGERTRYVGPLGEDLGCRTELYRNDLCMPVG